MLHEPNFLNKNWVFLLLNNYRYFYYNNKNIK
jgi:hypothetical protein